MNNFNRRNRHGLTDRVLSLQQARKMAGISQPTHYRLEKKGDFPPRVKITEYKQGYLESDMLAWLRSRRAHGPEAA